MKIGFMMVALATLLTACAEGQEKTVIHVADYQVQSAAQLQQRIDTLNTQFAADFLVFKKKEINAFAHQFPLDINNLKTLNQHLVASTSLKPTKVAYCDLMNGYFSNLYYLGHYNLNLVDQIQLPNAQGETLKHNFSDSTQFYHFVMDRYTSYRQVQQTMGYGCNLKAALS